MSRCACPHPGRQLLQLVGVFFLLLGLTHCSAGSISSAQGGAVGNFSDGSGAGTHSGGSTSSGSSANNNSAANTAAVGTTGAWVTSHDLSSGLTSTALATGTSNASVTLTIDTTQRYQSITGFGGSLTDSSSFLMGSKLTASAQKTLMSKLFDPSAGIGISFLRQPMGASDFSSVGNFSYDDTASDNTLTHFSVQQDGKYTLPLLNQAQGMAPSLFILATPWSPPAWMKGNNSMNGGTNASLITGDYPTYANYFVKTYQAYASAGVTIDAFTPQNEPLNNNGSYPTTSMQASEEVSFVGSALGPALNTGAQSAQVWGYDHNWDRPDYPAALLADPTAAPYIGAVAWHCYAGAPSAMTTFHQQNPNVDQHMTECAGGSWQSDPLANTIDLFIDSTNNWAKSVVLWNLALDASGGPTNGGCPDCRGIVTIDTTNNNDVTFNADYYALGHFSKFVRPGAVRVGLGGNTSNLGAVAFQNTNGSLSTVVHNKGSSAATVAIAHGQKSWNISVPANGIVTVVLAGNDAQ